MKKSLIITLVIGAMLISFLVYKKMNTVKFTILHTNDHHGKFWKDKNGDHGMAARATLIKRIKGKVTRKGREFFLLSAGDINTGSFESDLLQAEPDFMGMNLMKYDAMALGNHEFDHPLEVTLKQEKLATFPFLSANVFYQDNGKKVFKSYKTFNRSGLNISIYGLTTETTPARINDKRLLDFRDPIKVAKDEITDIKAKSDILIGLTHLGCYHDNPSLVDKTGDIHLVKNVSGFDMIIGGHSQVALSEPVVVNGVPIVQAKEYGEFVGRIDFEYFAGKIRGFKYELIPITDIKEDQEMLDLLSPYIEKAKELGDRVIAYSNDFFIGKDRNVVRRKEAALGNLIGEAYRKRTGADISILGGGSIRTDLLSGDITFKNVREILPFGNTLTTAKLTGAQLKDYLTPIVKLADGQKNGAFPQMTGIEVIVNSELLIQKIKVLGQEIENEKLYKVVMDNYLAKREKQYPRLSEFKSFVDTGYVDYLSFIEFLKSKKKIYKKDFEIQGDIRIEK